MAQVIEGLYYSEEHDYVKVEDGMAYIGISDYAQEHLGEIVYVELPEVGDEFAKGDVLYVIESVKAAADVLSVIGGEVIEVNSALEDEPELLNSDPYGNWIVKVKLEDEAQLKDLLNASDYEKLIAEE